MADSAYQNFVLFGTDHLVTMAIIAAAAVSIPFAVRSIEGQETQRQLAIVLGVLLVAHEAFKFTLRVYVEGQPLVRHLPLHLCSLETLLVAYLLIRKSYSVFEVAYFWGFGGTVTAILTPDVPSGFPTNEFVIFFLGHGLVIVGLVMALFVYRFRPTLRSLVKTVWVTLTYMAFVGIVNAILDTNYLFLAHKPAQATVLDYLGPWPWYIGPYIGVGLLVCCIVYLPVALLNRRAERAALPKPY